ncbi:MAG: 4Fe-4S binding protein [Planctomycetota bacterium]|jgi:polyferredoxin
MAHWRFPRIPWRWQRRLTQTVFLAGFLYLFRLTELPVDFDEIAVPGYVNIAFRLDPLLALAAMLAARAFIAAMLLSLITVALTLMFGRAFCGWICPLGTLLHWSHAVLRVVRGVIALPFTIAAKAWPAPGGPPAAGDEARETAEPTRLASVAAFIRNGPRRPIRAFRPVRYWVLAAVLIGALFGLPLAGYVDPFSILMQGLTFVVDPALSQWAFEGSEWLRDNASESMRDRGELAYAFARNQRILAFGHPAYLGAFVALGVLVAVFALDLVQRRFWCANLCPLGALLGLIARLTPFGRRPAQACPGCGHCAHTCRMGAINSENQLEPQSCTVCMDCVDSCPNQIAKFFWWLPKKRRDDTRKGPTPAPVELSRRGFIGACATGVALPIAAKSAAALGVTPRGMRFLRPPGARPEAEFLDRCIRCGECMKVCITNGLQPVLLEAGPEGLFTPRLVPRFGSENDGYCEYGCTLCGQVCPTAAIEPLPLADKQQFKIGEAVFDEERCLPHAEDEDCIVCEEHCPVPDKAIKFEEKMMPTEWGGEYPRLLPFVDLDLCIGCGICESVCPVDGEAAVKVVPVEDEMRRAAGAAKP